LAEDPIGFGIEAASLGAAPSGNRLANVVVPADEGDVHGVAVAIEG
jgi:hypothetical protein